MGAICEWCSSDMMQVDDCTGNRTVSIDGHEYATIPYNGPGVRCHDCNVVRGARHHPGCDMERCPKCGGQLISCGCLDEEEDPNE